MTWVRNILIFLIRVYQWTLSPVLKLVSGPTGGCRFSPSCSHYAVEALKVHGAMRGGALAARRICRCHPWGGSGEDPVPGKKFKVQSLKFKVGEAVGVPEREAGAWCRGGK